MNVGLVTMAMFYHSTVDVKKLYLAMSLWLRRSTMYLDAL